MRNLLRGQQTLFTRFQNEASASAKKEEGRGTSATRLENSSSHHVSFLFFLSFLFELIFVSFLFFFDARIVWYAWLPLVDEIRLLDHRVTIWRFEIKKKRRGLGTYYRGKTRRTLLINRPVNKQASSYGRAINRRVINSGPTRRRFLNGKRILR